MLKSLLLCLMLLLISLETLAMRVFPHTQSLLPTDAQALHFDGNQSFLSFDPWLAEDKHRLVVWIEHLGEDWTYLVSTGDDGFLAVNNSSFRGRFNGKIIEYLDEFDFADSGYIEITIRNGKITVSDGRRWISRNNPNVVNQPYRHIMRHQQRFSRATLQGLKLIDYGNPNQTMGFYFEQQQLRSTAFASQSNARLHHIKAHHWRLPRKSVQLPPPLLASQVDWDRQFQQLFPDQRPLIGRTEGNDRDRFTWHGHYWLRAYLTMAETFDDDKYLDYAIELIDHIFRYSDTQRQARDELRLTEQPYALAPLPYLNTPQQAAPGWRRPYRGMRIEVLSDGHILNAILRVVDYIKREKKQRYQQQADDYLILAVDIIRSHQTGFSATRQPDVEGSYYYPKRNSANSGDEGLHPDPVPFNHSLTMAVAKIYANHWQSQPDLELETQIRQISQFFSDSVEFFADGSCRWQYRHQLNQTEDINHGHIDIGFALVAQQHGYLDQRIARCAAQTITQRVFRAPGMIAADLDGLGMASPSEQLALSVDWVELAQYDPRLVAMNRHLLRHYGKPNWSRAFLGWASLLKWEQRSSALSQTGSSQAPTQFSRRLASK